MTREIHCSPVGALFLLPGLLGAVAAVAAEPPLMSGDWGVAACAAWNADPVLTRDLVESGRVGRELLAQLEDRGGPDLAAQELARKLDALATLNAQREGDLAACRYHVQQLQAELGEEQSQARQQLDELREQLRSAQARLQQQAALLEQAGSGVGPESIDTA